MKDVEYDIPIGIPEFYKGKSIFITGFTGSIGKLITEKLLFSCPEVDKIYVLIRPKKGWTPQQRVQEIMKSLAFDRLRKKYPGALESKVVALSGDILEDKLGLSQQDEQLLRDRVSIIFHGAATVKFDEPLKAAIEMNTLGTKKMVDLALTMPHLVCFTHISTAYTNCDHDEIKEEMYPPRADWMKTIEVVKNVDYAATQILQKKYINRMPNTYTFSKSLAEDVINEYKDKLPVVVVRPAIVTPSLKEPVPAWSDNKYGPVGLIIGYALGLIRCSILDGKARCNYVPSDIVVNALLIITWVETLTRRHEVVRGSVKTYNICSPLLYNLKHNKNANIYKEDKSLILSKDRRYLNFENITYYSSIYFYKLNNLYRQVFPAYVIDLILILAKKKPMVVNARKKTFCLVMDLSFFSRKTFLFDTDKFDSVLNYVKLEDMDAFSWDFSKSSNVTIYNHLFNIARYTTLKVYFDNIETYRKAFNILYYVDKACIFLTLSLIPFTIYQLRIPQLVLSALISFATLQ